jgi:hypothetical protein
MSGRPQFPNVSARTQRIFEMAQNQSDDDSDDQCNPDDSYVPDCDHLSESDHDSNSEIDIDDTFPSSDDDDTANVTVPAEKTPDIYHGEKKLFYVEL